MPPAIPLSLSFCEDASLERLELAVRQRQKLFTFCGGSCCCCLFVVPPKRRQLGQQASCPYRLYEICHVRRAAHSGKGDFLMYNNNNFKYCILFTVIQIRLLLNYNKIFLFNLYLYLYLQYYNYCNLSPLCLPNFDAPMKQHQQH